MLVKAWNNGKFLPNGGGYGIEISGAFRDEFLDIDWPSIMIKLDGTDETVELAINSSVFWSHGRELRSAKIGKWLIKNGKATWDEAHPVEIILTPIGGNVFSGKLKLLD